MKVVGNKQLALAHFSAAEKLKNIYDHYKMTGVIEKATIAPKMTPELLYPGRNQQFTEIILKLEQQKKFYGGNAMKCMDGAEKVLKPEQKDQLKKMAQQLIDKSKVTTKWLTQIKNAEVDPWTPPPAIVIMEDAKGV